MRVLFVVASPEYLGYYDSVLRLLAERGHDVAIAVNHVKEQKQARFDGVSDTVRVAGLVPARDDRWSALAKGMRGTMDFARYLHPRFREAPALRDRMKRKVLPRALRWMDRIPSLGDGTLHALYAALRKAERGVPVSARLVRFLETERPDVLVVSPLIDAASDQVDLVRAARRLGVRVAVGIASWDNLTNKGLLRVEPDRVLLWNEAQKAEAIELHGIPAEKIAVTGAQLFDRWFERSPGTSRAEFCAQVGLPDERPFLLYTASSVFIARSELELPFVRRWLGALRGAMDPAVREAAVLVRPHPYNWHAWEHADLSEFGPVAIWPRGPYSAVDEGTRTGFYDSMCHSAAVVGVNTSAMLESAIVGRPVFSLTGDFGATQEGTLHFHHLLPENGGFLRVARTLDEHVAQLGTVLRRPEQAVEETRRFVASFVRPHGVERPCTPIVADEIERLAQMPPPAPEQDRVTDVVVRAALRPLAMFVNARPPSKSKSKSKAKDKSKSKATAKSTALAPKPGDPYATYLEVRDSVARMRRRGPATDGAGATASPSAYWTEELGNIDYMAEASPLVIAKLRHHAFNITGLRPYDYRDGDPDRRALFEERLRTLIERGGPELVVAEHPALGGFGFQIDGQLYNLDTLKFLEVLVGMKRAGALAPFVGTKRRRTVWEIGAGWGGFAYTFGKLCPHVTYVITDFPELFLFSATYLRTVFPAAKILMWDGRVAEADRERWRDFDFVFVPHTRTAELPGFAPDLLVNIASFQEMTAAQVREYTALAANARCPSLYSLNRERSPHNAELTSVSELLAASYDLTDVTPLDTDYTKAMKKRSRAVRRLSDEQMAADPLAYRHLMGRLRAAAPALMPTGAESHARPAHTASAGR